MEDGGWRMKQGSRIGEGRDGMAGRDWLSLILVLVLDASGKVADAEVAQKGMC